MALSGLKEKHTSLILAQWDPCSDRHRLFFPHYSVLTVAGRIRVNSESHASTVSRDEELQARGEDEAGTPTDGAPFRGRSKSAPPALWAAKKYGRQLRRMSDEFDSLLDKGVRISLIGRIERFDKNKDLHPNREVERQCVCPRTYYLKTCLFFMQEMRKTASAGSAKQMHHSRSWWSYLFSHQELEGENGHHETPTHRTE